MSQEIDTPPPPNSGRLYVYNFNILFGGAAAILIGRFIGFSCSGFTSLLLLSALGALIGALTARRIPPDQEAHKNTRGLLAVCVSLWFGITAGMVAGAMLAQVILLPLFTYNFGNPETSPWPPGAANTFLVLFVSAIACGALALGAWFFSTTLKSRFLAPAPDQTDQ